MAVPVFFGGSKLGKSKQQREAERLDLERQRQQTGANKWMEQFSRELSKVTQERFTKEQEYLEGKVDPLLTGYATRGFAPGERSRLRNIAREDVGKAYGQEERRILSRMGASGYSRRAPTGAMSRVQFQLGRGRAEAKTSAFRDIEQMGATRRYGAIQPMLQRARAFNPQGPLSGVFPGRPTDVRQAQFGPGFWSKFGNVALDLTKSAIGAANPLGRVAPSTGGTPPIVPHPSPKTYPNPFSRVT